MGFIGLTLTKAGRRLIASAISEENPLNITHIQLGEGVCEGTFAEMKGLAKKVMEIPVKSVKRDEGNVIVNCDFNSTEAPKGFYFREVGIIGNGVLCYYDNSGDDAEYIDPETETVVKQKRLRFTLAVSSDVTVTVKISSELYAMAEEVEILKKSVSDGKMNVAEAITDMGIETESTEDSPATFSTLVDHIREITPVLALTDNTAKAKVGSNEVTEQIGDPMGGEITPGASDALLIPAGTRVYASSDYIMKSLGGNAEAAHVLTGKTFSSNISGREKAGTMANQGAKTAALNCGDSYTIPAGYHNGSGKVTANSLGSQTAPDSGKSAAGAGQILTGYQAFVNGSKVSGTMANQGAKTASLNCGGTYTIPAGYHNGSGKVTANSLTSQTAPDSGKSAAGAAQILTGHQAFVNGSKVSGTMANQGAKTAALNCGGTYTIPAGYHNGSGKVTANSLADQITVGAVLNKYKNTFKSLSPCPADMTDANCHYNGSNAIFLVGGKNPRYMLRYNIKENTWTEMAQTPKNVPPRSSVMYANEILCFYEGKVQIYNVVTGSWDTGGMTVPSSAQGGCVAMVDAPIMFSSINSNYYRYITKYNHAHNTNEGTFTTIKTDVNSTVADVMRGNACTVLMCNPGTSNNVSVFSSRTSTVYSLATPTNNYSSYAAAKTLPGNVYGGVTVIPNSSFLLTAVNYTNQNLVWDENLTTVWSDSHNFYTSALCAVGDDVYIFGSNKAGDGNKASVFHTEQYLKTHY